MNRRIMSKKMIISADEHEVRIAVLEGDSVVELYFGRRGKQSLVGNIYSGRVQNVLPGLNAAFIDIGEEKNAFLYMDEVFVPPELMDDSGPVPQQIHKVLKPGQSVIVQVIKDPIKSKGPRLTTFISIPGRFLVLMPYSSGIGVSRKLDNKERERLREIAHKIRPREGGIIVRTAAKGVDDSTLKRDLKYLTGLWSKIKRKIGKVRGPEKIFQELDLLSRVLRDTYSDDFETIITDSKDIKNKAVNFLRKVDPVAIRKVGIYREEDPLFEKYNVDQAIELALKRRVDLQSGGYLIIDHTEALTAIDVNTGRFVGRRNLEDTILRTNLEAAEEIVRQIRLRDIGGMIIIDFIDMERPENRDKVMATFTENLKKDQTKTQVVELSRLGLIEMTRKNVSEGIVGTLCKKCPFCGGLGHVLSEETMRLRVEREIKKIARSSPHEAFLFRMNSAVAAMVIGQGGSNLRRLERDTGRTIIIRGDDSAPIETFLLMAEGDREEIEKAAVPVQVGQILDLEVEEPHLNNPRDAISKLEGYIIQIMDGRKYLRKRIKVKIVEVTRTCAYAEVLNDD
ncbi:ribonuclease G [Candidatus Hakubella thermalkaliphila]|uniref:Ribonuclease G n=3 Tax=Candidatus Hakubella thermalkaliphila TaxID=2754717 RepID=A0A6V8P6P9_9ACTN|nr:Rne/Rng family ribonuclease [Candidatus Hakubella thermalkaliphila]GFP27314.1 ribonuclease G [Candidatus Hakubella thermalkaliphila]GFP34676.1 ribonuclease G [Candidatus Hakubella thermalkaliphila]